MPNNRFSDIIYFAGGGFIAAHLHKDETKKKHFLRITIVRNDRSSGPLTYDHFEPKLFDASERRIEANAAHPPQFICIDNSQECGLYEISESAYDKTNSLETSFGGARYKFQFGKSRPG